jgi:hypothetical protein
LKEDHVLTTTTTTTTTTMLICQLVVKPSPRGTATIRVSTRLQVFGSLTRIPKKNCNKPIKKR